MSSRPADQRVLAFLVSYLKTQRTRTYGKGIIREVFSSLSDSSLLRESGGPNGRGAWRGGAAMTSQTTA